MNAIAKRADGKFENLSEAEKQQAIQMAGGNEAQARSLIMMRAHPPNGANRAKMGQRAGPPNAPGK